MGRAFAAACNLECADRTVGAGVYIFVVRVGVGVIVSFLVYEYAFRLVAFGGYAEASVAKEENIAVIGSVIAYIDGVSAIALFV